MNNLNEYYEKYWEQEKDVSDTDVTTPERKGLLLKTVSHYLKPGGYILDLGCGGGQFTSALQKAGYNVIGMDISEKALNLARRQFTDCRFQSIHPDYSIPIPDAQCTAVWCSEVIEHVVDIHFFLSEINRVLRPGGILILTTPYHSRFKNVLISLLKFDRHFDPEGSHIRFFDRKGLSRCLKKADFSVLSFRGLGRIRGIHRTWFVVSSKADH